MAKKKEAKIKNSKSESATDFAAVKDDAQWEAKTIEAESETKLEDDKGTGEAITLRFFDFAANPATFKDHLPTPQELFNSHVKQIEIELWKDEWRPVEEVQPRILFAKDKSHYRIVIAARPALRSHVNEKPKTLLELAHDEKK